MLFNVLKLTIYRAHSNEPNDNAKTDLTPSISCVICGKDRTSENEMIKHMQKHKDNRHFCCDICVFRTVQLKKVCLVISLIIKNYSYL